MPTSQLTIDVQIDDLDHAGHVGHARWVSYLERGRIHLLGEVGLDLRDFLDKGIQIVVADLNVRFRRPATLGDRLCVRTSTTDLSSDRVAVAASIRMGAAEDAPICLEADVHLAFIGDAGDLMPAPQKLLAALSK